GVPPAQGDGLRGRAHHGREHRDLDGRVVRRDARAAVRVLATPQQTRDGAGEGGGGDREPRGGRRPLRDRRDGAVRHGRGGRPPDLGAQHGGGAASPGRRDPLGGGRGGGDGHGKLGLHGAEAGVSRDAEVRDAGQGGGHADEHAGPERGDRSGARRAAGTRLRRRGGRGAEARLGGGGRGGRHRRYGARGARPSAGDARPADTA